MKISHNNQKKIAVVNDFTGFGRCSLAVSLPIISAMGIQCCPLPTSILSNHTGFKSFFFDDYTDKMESYIDEWRKLDLKFNGICTGFLGSAEQIDIVGRFLEEFGRKDNIIVIDPVMGDYGKPYATYTPEMCQKMKELVKYADIITPNLTEACVLTDTPYKEKMSLKELKAITEKLMAMGPDKVVITGIIQRSFVANYCCVKGSEPLIRRTHKIGNSRSGTGDIFAAIVACDAVNGVDFGESVKKASRFISACIAGSVERDIPLTDGVCFEDYLYKLTKRN